MNKDSVVYRLRYRLHKLCDPEKGAFAPDAKDIYIVSYPRSGNTWMRVMMAELLYGDSGESIKDLQFYVPDIHVATKRKDVIQFPVHAVKSHLPLKVRGPDAREVKHYKQVIYIIRDPRDVALSYYRYLNRLGRYDFSFDNFLLDWLKSRIWPGSWHDHVNSWTGDEVVRFGVRLHFVRYEDLLADAASEIKKIAERFSLNPDDRDYGRIVSKASVSRMKQKEQSGMRERETAKGFEFVGAAKNNNWKGALNSDQESLISDFAGNVMSHFGYT